MISGWHIPTQKVSDSPLPRKCKSKIVPQVRGSHHLQRSGSVGSSFDSADWRNFYQFFVRTPCMCPQLCVLHAHHWVEHYLNKINRLKLKSVLLRLLVNEVLGWPIRRFVGLPPKTALNFSGFVWQSRYNWYHSECSRNCNSHNHADVIARDFLHLFT